MNGLQAGVVMGWGWGDNMVTEAIPGRGTLGCCGVLSSSGTLLASGGGQQVSLDPAAFWASPCALSWLPRVAHLSLPYCWQPGQRPFPFPGVAPAPGRVFGAGGAGQKNQQNPLGRGCVRWGGPARGRESLPWGKAAE